MSGASNELSELIDHYISAKLKGEEKAKFETNMAIDTSLFEAVEKQKVIQSLLVESGLNDIRQMMSNDFKRESQFQKTKWIGGSLLLLAVTGIGLYMISPLVSEKKIVEVKDKVVINNTTASNQTGSLTIKEATNYTKENKIVATNENEEVVTAELNNNVVSEEKEITVEKLIQSNAKLPETDKLVSENANVVIADPCVNFKPKYSIRTSPSVVNKETGKLTVLSDDKKLTFALNNGKASFNSTFDELGYGSYSLTIKNDDGCLYKDQSIKIAQTYCLVIEKERFSPEVDQEYTWPIVLEAVVSIKIYNKQMQEIRNYSTHSTSWDGRNREGQLVDTGLYKIEIVYKSGERCLFNLTVFK